ncbi:septal ring lytic transglycosylase RlpA family protein [Bacillus subtilis]|nr:septal ring lytic transglycosylase RlpA family protein [Bacillus subtilis]
MGRHSAPSTKKSGSIISALTAKKKTGRHAPADRQNTAGGVLAAVRTRPVLSAFIVPTAATAAVVASSLALVPNDSSSSGQVVAEAPAVAVSEPTKATDEFLAKAKKQAKEKPAEVTIDTHIETPSPEPSKTADKKDEASTGGGETSGNEGSSGGGDADESDGPSNSGKSAGESGSCPMSYYGGGDGFDGRKTANGEIFDTNKLTAAHKTLPFGSKVKITNTANGKSVTVRVNDRGPYHGNRCFDLSKAAMEAVGGVGAGQINGKYEVQ